MEELEKIKNPTWWREKCLTDLYFLCRVVLQTLEDPTPGYKDLYKPTHKTIADFVSTHAKPEQRLLLLCPRGWIKSYIVVVGWTIQKLLQNLVSGKGDSILISNATFENAKMFLEKIKYNLEHNELLRALFPEIPKNPSKAAKRWTLDGISLNRTSIEVGSVEGNLVSRHYSIMINDDLVNKENSSTQLQIEKVIDWWKLARSLLEAKGTEIIIGTRWYADDLYGYILREFFNITEKDFEKHRSQPKVEVHNKYWHYLRYLCWQDPVAERGSTFPVLFPEEKLHQIKTEQREFFEGQYLNDPFSTEGSFFKPSWFRYWEKGQLPEINLAYMLVDPAGKETKDSDNTGLVVVKAGVDKKYYVIYAKRRKISDLKVAEWIIEIASYYQPFMIGIEENKFEIYRELISFLAPQMVRARKVARGSEEFILLLANTLVPLRHRNRPKELRVKNLQGWIESGNLLFSRQGMEELKDEILRFGKTVHDDIVDALAYVLDIGIFPNPVPKAPLRILTAEEREKAFWEGVHGKSQNLLGEID